MTTYIMVLECYWIVLEAWGCLAFDDATFRIRIGAAHHNMMTQILISHKIYIGIRHKTRVPVNGIKLGSSCLFL